MESPQRREFSPAQAGIRQERDKQLVGTAGDRQLRHLLMSKKRLLLLHHPGQAHTLSNVSGEPPVSYGQHQHQREHPVRLAHSRRRIPLGHQITDPGHNAGMSARPM